MSIHLSWANLLSSHSSPLTSSQLSVTMAALSWKQLKDSKTLMRCVRMSSHKIVQGKKGVLPKSLEGMQQKQTCNSVHTKCLAVWLTYEQEKKLGKLPSISTIFRCKLKNLCEAAKGSWSPDTSHSSGKWTRSFHGLAQYYIIILASLIKVGSYVYQSILDEFFANPIPTNLSHAFPFTNSLPQEGVLWKTQGPPIPNSSASSADSDASAASSSSAKASVGLDDKSRFTTSTEVPSRARRLALECPKKWTKKNWKI